MELTRNEINSLKFKYNDKYNNLSLIELVKTIQDENFKLDISTFDAKYKYEIIKKNIRTIENREETIIIYGNIENMKNIEAIKQQEIFVDTTFKIIPKKFHPYKLMTISYLSEKNIKILCFILYKYQDHINYERIFTYMRDNYNLNPDIVHTDYEKALYMVFQKDNIYKKKILHGFCYFHYVKAIREKMKKINLTSKKLNKKSYEILKNIEILSFINKDNLKEYIKFIYEEIGKDSKYKLLIPYLEKNWFSKNPDMYNYSTLLDYKKKSEKNKYLEKLYLTNNISESLHSKINYYLPKYSTSSQNFSESMIKVFLDDTIKLETVKRYDIKSRAIIDIIKEFQLNKERKWIKFEIFKKFELKLLNENFKDDSDIEINTLYKEINYDLNETEEKKNSDNEENIINEYVKNNEKENENVINIDIDNIDNSCNIINNENVDIISKDDEIDNNEHNEEKFENYNILNLYTEITNNIDNINLNTD